MTVQSFGHNPALWAKVVDSILHSQGIIKIVGEPGSEMTRFSNKLHQHVASQFDAIYIPDASVSTPQLLKTIVLGLGVTIPDNASHTYISGQLNACLRERDDQGRRVILIIERADLLTSEAFGIVRLLTNLETEKNKLLQVVLIGGSDLDDMLAQTQQMNVRNRISSSFYLGDPNEFVAKRVYQAGEMRSLSLVVATIMIFFTNGLENNPNHQLDLHVFINSGIYDKTERVLEQELLAVASQIEPAAASDKGAPKQISDLISNANDWLTDPKEDRYCLQLLTAIGSTDQSLHREIAKLAKQVPIDTLSAYRARIKGKESVGILFGRYRSNREALNAITLLPDAIQAYQPMVRSIEGIKRERRL